MARRWPSVSVRSSQTLAVADAAGDSLPLVTVPGYRTSPINGVPARQLLDAEGVVATSDSTVCAGYSDRFVITCYGPTGRARLRISRDVAPRALREEDRVMVRQAYLDANRDAPPAVRQQMATAVQAFPFASTAPVFSRLVFGSDGELWVSPFDPGYGLPGLRRHSPRRHRKRGACSRLTGRGSPT
jgi:hypothetical protein